MTALIRFCDGRPDTWLRTVANRMEAAAITLEAGSAA